MSYINPRMAFFQAMRGLMLWGERRGVNGVPADKKANAKGWIEKVDTLSGTSHG